MLSLNVHLLLHFYKKCFI